MVADQLVCLTEIENALRGPEETHKLSFYSYTVTYRLFSLVKTDTEVATLTHTYTLIVAIWLFILAAPREMSGRLLNCA